MRATIRGPVDAEHLTADLAYTIGLAIGAEAAEQGEKTFIVGRDALILGLHCIKPYVQDC